MNCFFFVIFITIFVSELNGQSFYQRRIGDVSGYQKWKGVLKPLILDWNNIVDNKNSWNSIDYYQSDYNKREYTDDVAIKYFIMTAQPPQPQHTRPTLSDLIRDNQLNEILGFPDKTGLTLSGQPLDVLSPIANDFSKPGRSPNLIPDSMIASRPFRMATLASMGYGPNFRYYP